MGLQGSDGQGLHTPRGSVAGFAFAWNSSAREAPLGARMRALISGDEDGRALISLEDARANLRLWGKLGEFPVIFFKQLEPQLRPP